MSAQLYLLAMALCAACSALFSGMESGVLTLNQARLVHLMRTGSRVAHRLHDYVADMQRFLATILVGNNLVNVTLSTLSAGLSQLLFPGHHLAQTAWGVGIACAMLVFCEYLPKLFFTTRPLRRTLLATRVFALAERALTPLTILVLFLTKWLVPKNRNAAEARSVMSREYIQNIVSDPKDGSRITAFERLMINRVLSLQTRTAAQLMSPLNHVPRISEQAPLAAGYRLVRDSGHVRLPVFSSDGARCVGVLNALDSFAAAPNPEQARAGDFMRPPLFVRDDVRADDVLPLMRKNRQPLAVVSSAAGDVLGFLNEESVLNELVGNL
jgi:CBS domain containing-hemolysin-like protein